MLVILSDLHLTDGTADATLSPESFFLFAERLRELATRAAWRADGQFRPLERIDILLLGDVLDIIHSKKWIEGTPRPWHDVSHADVQQSFAAVVDGILANNAEGLGVFRALATQGAMCLAPGNGTLSGSEAYRVPVRIHYMVGNHDWALHLPGVAYDAMRQKVCQHLGLANAPSQPFAHDAYESDEILEVLRRHRTLARHGDIFDPLHFSEDRDVSSLGDALNIEVIRKFLNTMQNELAGDLPSLVLANLHEIDNVRPLPMVPIFINGLLERACPNPALRKRVKQVWDKNVDVFLDLDVVRRRDTWLPFDVVDGLANVMRFSSRSALGWAVKVDSWLHSMRGANSDSYYTHALAEQDFRNRRARHIVYGHTHAAECIPLDASYADGYVLNQMYFNSGSWRRVHRATVAAPQEEEFIPSESINLVTFFTGDERAGRPFETWSGVLGIGAADAPLYRLDAGKAAAAQPAAAAAAPLKAPHFGQSAGTLSRPTMARR
jgi:UDP-2,3-diacylglucosamine pyrophosphatase LpxH